MIWWSFDGSVGGGRHFFLLKGVSMNSVCNQEVLQDKLIPIFRARWMRWFLQDSTGIPPSTVVPAFGRKMI